LRQPFIVKRAALYKKNWSHACAINGDRGNDDDGRVRGNVDVPDTLQLSAQQNILFDDMPDNSGNVYANDDDVCGELPHKPLAALQHSSDFRHDSVQRVQQNQFGHKRPAELAHEFVR
jgi:hypothetical protein